MEDPLLLEKTKLELYGFAASFREKLYDLRRISLEEIKRLLQSSGP
jgi:hypothetical protein